MKVNNLEEKKPFDSWTSGQLNPDYYQDVDKMKACETITD